MRRTISCRCGMQAFLFCHNVWPSCYVTIPQFCHSAWQHWRNTPDLCIRYGHDAALQFMVVWGA